MKLFQVKLLCVKPDSKSLNFNGIALQKMPVSRELTLLSIKGKNNFSRKVLLEPEESRNGMFSQDRETDLMVPTEPKWLVKSLDIFFSIFGIIFL